VAVLFFCQARLKTTGLRFVFEDVFEVALGACGGWLHAKMKLALVPNMMYLSRVYAQTQFKSKSLKPRENTVKEKTRKVARNRLFVRQQTHKVGMIFRIKDCKWEKKKGT